MTGFIEVQRVAAYGLAVDHRQVLLTRLSDVTSAPGHWTLPGGGIDPGEHPRDAVVRELFEETGLRGAAVRLLGVDSFATTRAVGDDATERYHAVRVLYRLEVVADREPYVVDVGGSTDEARWVDLDATAGLPLVPVAEWALTLVAERGTPA